MADSKVAVLDEPNAGHNLVEHPGGGIRYGSIHQYMRMVTCVIYFGGGIIWYVLSYINATAVALILATVGFF